MKSLMKLLSFFMLLSIANVSFAGQGIDDNQPDFAIKKAGEKTFLFESRGMTSAAVEVFIQDESGRTLFSEYAIDASTFERKYNLSELNTGLYYLVVKTSDKTQILPIRILEDDLKMDFDELETI